VEVIYCVDFVSCSVTARAVESTTRDLRVSVSCVQVWKRYHLCVEFVRCVCA